MQLSFQTLDQYKQYMDIDTRSYDTIYKVHSNYVIKVLNDEDIFITGIQILNDCDYFILFTTEGEERFNITDNEAYVNVEIYTKLLK